MDSPWEDDAVVIRPEDYAGMPPPPAISEADLERVTKWLEPTDYDGVDSDLAKHLAARAAGTGTWLLESETFSEWLSSQEHGLVWICGVPGAGKSVMAATVVEKLHEEKAGRTLYFFIRNVIDAHKTAAAALRDWLAQLLPYSPSLQTELFECCKKSRLSAISTEDLWRYLMMGASSVPCCYIVADALDEMDDSEDFAQALVDLGKLKPDTIKVVCTSRPSPKVQQPFLKAKTIRIRLDSESVDRDILAYVEQRLNTSNVPTEYKERIKAAVPGRANGLFLYARLAMDTVTSERVNLDASLATLPLDLQSMYTGLLRENSERTGVSWSLQMAALQFATHATRPLRLIEIADCLMRCHDMGNDLGEAKELVRRSCGNLIEILPNETVSVIHHSLTEFLRGSPSVESQGSGVAHRGLALLCIAYMRKTLPAYPLGEKEDGSNWHEIKSQFEVERKERKAHFSGYAETNWHIHIGRSTDAGADQEPTVDALDSILGDTVKQMRKSVSTVHPSDSWTRIPRNSTTLQAALRFRLHHYSRVLSSRPVIDMESAVKVGYDNDRASPLVLACEAGYMDVVEALLQRGIDVDSTADIHGLKGANCIQTENITALQFAAWKNDVILIQKLLQNGASMPALPRPSMFKGLSDSGTLERAAAHLEACKILAPLSVDARAVFDALRAAMWHQPANVELLVKHPLVNLKTRSWGRTLLHIAASGAYPDSLRCLLQAGADVDDEICYDPDTDEMEGLERARDHDVKYHAGRVALHCWTSTRISRDHGPRTEEDTRTMLRLLVDAGSNVNHADKQGNTPLHLVETPLEARLLIEAGADLDAVNKKGDIPIVTFRNGSSYEKDAELMKLLDQHDVKHGRRVHQLSPLIKAIQRGDVAKALTIIEAGGILKGTDENGNCALHYAAAMCHASFNPSMSSADTDKKSAQESLQLVRDLCASGLNINVKNSRGQTPLHLFGCGPTEWSATKDSRPVLPVDALNTMLDLGADVTNRDNDGMTPLHSMVANFHGNWFQQPCSGCGRYHDELGPRVVMRTNYPNAVLALDVMLERGATLDTRDALGNNIVFAAVINAYNYHLMPWLVKHGMRATATDANGDTVYNFMIQHGGISQDVFDAILPLGLPVKQPNHRGRTALHSHSCLARFNISEREKRQREDARIWGDRVFIFHDVVQQFSLDDFDVPDNKGFTPLLLAASANADLCLKLLQLGANPDVVTDTAKQNIFHIAAESGQANILGAAASQMKRRGDVETQYALINAADNRGKTPLYYAAASGQASSVEILVDFGARPDAGMCLRGCAAFEASLTKLTLDANVYPHGLEDTLSIMASWAVDPEDVDAAIINAAKDKHDYTVEAISSWQDALGMQPGRAAASPDVAASLQRRDDNREILRSELCDKTLGVDDFEQLMAKREYVFAVEHASPAMLTEILSDGKTVLHRLVAGGFVSILRKLLNKDIVASLVDALRTPAEDETSECLVLQACRRQQPSLGLLSLLVDDLGMDAAGVTFYTKGSVTLDFGMHDHSKDKVHECTLHVLARGQEWWHGALGIPYVIGKGVDVNSEVRGGRAIVAAIGRQIEHPRYYMTCAVESLLRCGANLKRKTVHDTTCLQLARQSPALLELLRPYDGRPDDKKLLSAIEDNDLVAVQALLEKGVDPNRPIRCEGYQVRYLDDEMSPLACALAMMRVHTGDKAAFEQYFGPNSPLDADSEDRNGLAANDEIVQLLMQRGADPNTAKYQGGNIASSLIHQANRSKSRIYKEKVLQFLQLPQLDVNHASNGYTYGGCSSLLGQTCDLANVSFTRALLDRGASLCPSLTQEELAASPFTPPAESVLHAFFSSSADQRQRLDSSIWERIVTDRSINQRLDPKGNVPLHIAVQSKHRSCFAVNMLDAGVDPWPLTRNGANVFHLLLSGGCDTFAKMDILERLVTLPGALAAISVKARQPKRYRESDTHETALRMLFHHSEMIKFKHHYHAKQVRLLQILDELGVDWAELDEDGQSLMHLAAKNTNRTHFEFLMNKGLDPRLEDARHQTPLDLAAQKDATNILSLFEENA
ncbi:hypothetical protein PWT90_01242 [Aphanocladium album]|nr:hypothetical protein PWT90_01242 [Aphanocladium album]